MYFLRNTLVCLAALLPVSSSVARAVGPIDSALVDQVFEEICRLQIQHPQMVMRQAILETGWMRARFLMDRQNLFGFRSRQYLKFDHWRDSVAYYKAWQERRYPSGEEDYAAFLQRVSYGNSSYVKHLRKIQWDRQCPEPADAPLIPSGASEDAAPDPLLPHQ
jgi:hypothetical protein